MIWIGLRLRRPILRSWVNSSRRHVSAARHRAARAPGVTQGAVSQWIARGRAGGSDALRNRSRKGATPKLTKQQRAQLPDLLKRGAEAYGFVGDVWTQARIASVIKREFGVSYPPDHIG